MAVVSAALIASTPKPPEYVRLLPIKPVVVKAQSQGTLTLTLKIQPGFHIQANPASAPNLIATTVSMAGPESVSWGDPVYPSGKPYRLMGAASEISTYDGSLEITIPFHVGEGLSRGPLKSSGQVRYQACNDKTCFFPAKLPFTVKFAPR